MAVNQEKKSADYNCPSDYVKLDNFKCEKLVSVLPPIYSCDPADGQLNIDQCVKKQEISQEKGYCEAPYQMDGGVCIQQFTQGYSVTCSGDSEQSGSKCYTHIITTEVPVQVCD